MASSTLARPADALPLGARLHGGKYTVGQVLGRGGFGITYRGRDQYLHRDVALKEYFPTGCRRLSDGSNVEAASIPDFQNGRAAFTAEARHLAHFNALEIVRVYEIFEANATTYMAMEYLAGATLTSIVETHGALSAADALVVAEHIGAALRALHADGFIHSDLKPDNVIVCGDLTSNFQSARIALIDFGLARRLVVSPYATQQLTLAAGTEGYAPPEQYSNGGVVGAFSDIYALGATLYFCLSAQAPSPAPARLSTPALPVLSALNAQIPSAMSTAIGCALSLPSCERPQSVDEFLAALRAPVASLSSSSPPAGTKITATGTTVLTPGTTVLATGETEVKVSARVLLWPHHCRCCNAQLPTQPAGMQRRRRFWCTRETIADWEEDRAETYCDACVAHACAVAQAAQNSALALRCESVTQMLRAQLDDQVRARRDQARREAEKLLTAPSMDATLTLGVGVLAVFTATILSGVLITGFMIAAASVVVFEIGRTLAFGREKADRSEDAARLRDAAEKEIATLVAAQEQVIAAQDAATEQARGQAAQDRDAARRGRGARCSCENGAVRLEHIAASQRRVTFTNPDYAAAFALVNSDKVLH